MPNPLRKFKMTYLITLSGRSRGFGDEPTFQEIVIKNFMYGFLKALRLQYKTLSIKLVKSDETKN